MPPTLTHAHTHSHDHTHAGDEIPLHETVTGTNHIDALLGGDAYRWNRDQPLGTATRVSYAFLTELPDHATSGDGIGFAPMTSAQRTAATQALALWAEVADITFTAGDEASADILFGTNVQLGSAAYAYLPMSWSDLGGDIYLNNVSLTNLSRLEPGDYGFMTIVHEIGHALGLKHPGNYDAASGSGTPPFLPADEDDYDHSVMSYHLGTSGLFAAAPMLYDIAAIQTLYGANTGTRTGDDVYRAASGHTMTIWDAGGTDTIDASGQSSGVTIDLRPGRFSSVGGVSNLVVAYGVTIEGATGGAGDDVLIASDAAGTFVGGSGNDRVELNGASATISQVETVRGSSAAEAVELRSAGRVAVAAIETLSGSDGSDWIDLADGSETIAVRGVETLVGGSGGDAVSLGGDGQRVILAAVETLSGGVGGDWVDLGNRGNTVLVSGIETLVGGTGADRVTTRDQGGRVIMAAVETLTGGTGSDWVDLGDRGNTVAVSGIETLVGGATADWVTLGDGGNLLTLSRIETLIGGAGADGIITQDRGGRFITAAVETITGGGGGDWVDLGDRGNSVVLSGVETLIGGRGGDWVSLGDAGNTVITAAVETIVGGSGGDHVTTGARGGRFVIAAVETLAGGRGGDWVSLGDRGNTVTVSGVETLVGGSGLDHVNLGDGGNTFITAAIETITGGAGADTIMLGDRGVTAWVSGIEALAGGAGTDAITIGSGGVMAVLSAGTDVITLAADGTADQIVLASAGLGGGGAFTTIDGFVSGVDRVVVADPLRSALDHDHDGAARVVPREHGQVGSRDEVVRLGTTLGGAVADASFAAFRAAVGSLSTGGTGAPMLVVADDGTDSGLFLVSDTGDGILQTDEVRLLAVIRGARVTATDILA